jgi:hypothetical protein
MKVAELIAELKKLPQDAEVIIGSETIHGVIVRRGRLSKEMSYFQTREFKSVDEAKARDSAVSFTRLTEFSDGLVDQMWI